MFVSPSLPPGPPPRHGLIASAKYFARHWFNPIGFVADQFDRYGDLYCVQSGTARLYVVRHPDHLREVLVTRASTFRKPTRLAVALGEGLLMAEGDDWTRQRRLVQPAFANARFVEYARVMTAEVARTTGRWSDGDVLDVSREMMQLTLRVVGRTLFGHDVSPCHVEQIGRAMQVFQSAMSMPDPPSRWARTPAQRKLPRAFADVDTMLYRLIERRRAHRSDGGDLLQVLLNAVDEEGDGRGLSERELRDQLVTLILAGHETTSHALTWTLFLLSQNPRVDRVLHDELDAALEGRAPAYDDLPRLTYTHQVLQEAMRLYPPVYSLTRKAHLDTEVGGYRVAAGSDVNLWFYMTHRDPRWWPEPSTFRPERFTPEEDARRPKLAYAPFGAGPRACIGKMFAMVEAQLLLATIARRFKLELARDRDVVPMTLITLVPKGGMRMKLRLRQGGAARR